MAKKIKELQVDGVVSFNVDHWSGKTLEEFTKEANKEGAEMTPAGMSDKDKTEWLTTVHGLIVRAAAGDETVTPSVNTEELKAQASADQAKKGKGKTNP